MIPDVVRRRGRRRRRCRPAALLAPALGGGGGRGAGGGRRRRWRLADEERDKRAGEEGVDARRADDGGERLVAREPARLLAHVQVAREQRTHDEGERRRGVAPGHVARQLAGAGADVGEVGLRDGARAGHRAGERAQRKERRERPLALHGEALRREAEP